MPSEVLSESSAAIEAVSTNNRLATINQTKAAFLKLVISPPGLDTQRTGYSSQFRPIYSCYLHPTLRISLLATNT
jgi:hypothetical protein